MLFGALLRNFLLRRMLDRLHQWRYRHRLRRQGDDDVKAMLKAHPEIDDSRTLIVNFNKFAPSSLDFFVYTFTHNTNWVHCCTT